MRRFLLLLVPLALSLVGPSCGHLSEEEVVDREDSFRDDGLVCDRVHDVMRARDPGRVYADLQGVALLVIRTQSGAPKYEACAESLFAWIQTAVAAQPLDVRPRLLAQVSALGPFVASSRWHTQALVLLDKVLLGDVPRTLHWRENWLFLGPGSQKMPAAATPIVSSEGLDRAVAGALVQGYLNRDIDDAYADLLARAFGPRSSPPKFLGHTARLGGLGFGGLPMAALSLDDNRVGDGRQAHDLLWADLGRAFRHAPNHPRWQPLSATLRLRLSESRPLTPPSAD